MLKCIKQTERATGIKYQYNLQVRPQIAKKKEKRHGENENITEKRNGSISKRRKTLYRILGRTTPVTLQLFTDIIEG